MCIVAILVNQHDEYPLIIVSNRDEFLSRSSVVSYQKSMNSICGIDPYKAKGVWIGFNIKSNLFTVLTNINDGQGRRSRGLIVKKILKMENIDEASVFMENNIKEMEHQKGYHLVYGELNNGLLCHVCSRYEKKKRSKVRKLRQGIHIFGNDIDGDEFIKTNYLKSQLKQFLNENKECKNPRSLLKGFEKIMTQQQKISWFNCGLWIKFFKWTSWYKGKDFGGRRLQPGLKHYIVLQFMCLILWFMIALPVFIIFHSMITMIVLFIGMFLFCLIFGFHYHIRMQHLFIIIKPWFIPKKLYYGTISQSIILVSQDKRDFFYTRETGNNWNDSNNIRSLNEVQWDEYLVENNELKSEINHINK